MVVGFITVMLYTLIVGYEIKSITGLPSGYLT